MEEIKKWLTEIGDSFGNMYADSFAGDGWDDIDCIHLMSEADVKFLITKPGHSARVWAAITQMKVNKCNSTSTEKQRTTSSKTYSQKRLPFFDGDQSVILDEKPWTKLNIWYPFPKQNRCHFSNELLPAVYKAAFPCLQTKFTEYFSMEVAKRYDRKLKIQKWEKFITFKLSSENDASYRKLLHVPQIPKREHIKQCTTAVEDLRSKEKEISAELNKICISYNNLFDESGLNPRKWASEQIEYEGQMKSVLDGMVVKLNEGIRQIEITEKQLRKVYHNMASSECAKKRRRMKESKKKAKKRKSERLDKKALLFLTMITINEYTVDLCFPKENRKNLEKSQHYVTAAEINSKELEINLKKQRNHDALRRLLALEVFSMDSIELIDTFCHIDTDSETEANDTQED